MSIQSTYLGRIAKLASPTMYICIKYALDVILYLVHTSYVHQTSLRFEPMHLPPILHASQPCVDGGMMLVAGLTLHPLGSLAGGGGLSVRWREEGSNGSIDTTTSGFGGHCLHYSFEGHA